MTRKLSLVIVAVTIFTGCTATQKSSNTTKNACGIEAPKKFMFSSLKESKKNTRIYMDENEIIHMNGERVALEEWIERAENCEYKNVNAPYVYIDDRNTLRSSAAFGSAIRKYIYPRYTHVVLSQNKRPPKL